jgi:serine/threonine-protein kinase ULK4
VAPNPEAAQWEVPASTVGLVTRLLRAGEDEVTQHYAVKAIENIVTHGGEWAARFTSQDVVTNLATIYTTTRSDNLRPTAVSALSRLLRHSPAFVQVRV